MFSNSTTNLKQYKKKTTIELAEKLKSLRSLLGENQYSSNPNYLVLLEIKNKFFDKANLNAILSHCKSIKLNLKHNGSQEINAIIENLIHSINDHIHMEEKIVENKKEEIAPNSTIAHEPSIENNSPLKSLILNQIAQIETPEVTKDEVTLLLMQAESETNHSYHGFFIDVDAADKHADIKTNMESFLGPSNKLPEIERRQNVALFSEFEKIYQHCKSQGIPRAHIIIRAGVHYTAIDIDFGKASCFIIDAAANFRKRRYFAISKFCPFIQSVYDASSSVFVYGDSTRESSLQKDNYSCPIFSLDQSIAAAKIPDLHTYLENSGKLDDKTKIFDVDWFDLPPELIKCSQSTAFIAVYKEKNPEYAKQIDELTNNNTQFYAFNHMKNQYTNNIKINCGNKNEEQLSAILTEKNLKPINPSVAKKI